MHPTQEELIQFVDHELVDADWFRKIKAHVKTCEFCSEFCEDYRQLTRPIESLDTAPVPERTKHLANILFDIALRCKIIDLKPLMDDSSSQAVSYMAADGINGRKSRVRNVATLCSESPEIILRVMQSPEDEGDYLQLLAEDDRLVSHVMVKIPELGKEYITDADGRAGIDLKTTPNLEQLKWQVKMPDAVFELEPLKYDPEEVEYAREIVLETERHDRIEVRFEGKTEGKQLSIRVIELDGRADFGPIKVAVTQKDRADLISVKPGESTIVGPIDSKTTINIRLYQ